MIAMSPYMPTCQDVIDAVSALSACQMPCPTDRSRIGLMVKH